MTDFSDSAEHLDLRAAVREITAAHGPADYAEHARQATPQDGLWSDLAKAGFVGINVPAAYGGGGAGMTELALVAEESAAGGCPMLLLLVSSAIAVEVLARHGSDAQRRQWLPGLADGEIKLAFAITEPDAGSNSHGISTTAVRDGDEWVLRGSKYYISGIDQSAAVLTVARTGTDESTGRARISLFLIPTDAPGLSWTPIEMAAQIPDRQFTVFFDDVRVPAGALVGGEGQGLAPLFDGLNPPRSASASAGTRWPPRPGMPPPGRFGALPSAPTRPWPTRWPGPGSPWRPQLCSTPRRPGGTTTASRPGNRRTWPSTPPPRRPARPSTRPSRPTAGMGWPPSTAWFRCGEWPGCSGSPRSTRRWC